MIRLTIVLMILLIPVWSSATEEFATSTGLGCQFCHLDPSGGGELTSAGLLYLDQLSEAGGGMPTALKVFRFVVGYVHLIFGILWFGTILYVHLVLKPAYASRGLPRGEKLLGIVSFGVMGVTGVILTLLRFDSLAAIPESRFGVLLMIKVGLYLTMLLSAIVVIRWIGPRLKRGEGIGGTEAGVYTAESLAGYDGKDGHPAYFAYKGRVYDASDSRLWPKGEHMRRHQAGCDLTEELPLAPHAEEVISRLPDVGEYRVGEPARTARPAQVFYVLAYTNLLFVLAIILIIALWRWG